MKIILLQGNFPEKYKDTRHNVSFAFGDFLAKRFGAKFTEKPKFKAVLAEVSFSGQKIILVKPRTYYNETGFSARLICDFYKVDFRKDLLVIHDDLDLRFGVIRTRKNGSSAGNNGLKSIIATFSEEFSRIKIGIANDILPKIDSADFVLSKFSKEEQSSLPKIFEVCEQFTIDFIDEKFENTKKAI